MFYFERLLPRTTAAIVITLSAALLGTLLTTRVIVLDEGTTRRAARARSAADDLRRSAPRRPQPRPRLSASVDARAAANLQRTRRRRPAGDSVRLGEACRCVRSDSALWQSPIPRLSLLVLSQRARKGRGEDENKRKKYLEVELGVVNNGKTRRAGALAAGRVLRARPAAFEQALLGVDAAAVLRRPAAARASHQVERRGAGRGVRGAQPGAGRRRAVRRRRGAFQPVRGAADAPIIARCGCTRP